MRRRSHLFIPIIVIDMARTNKMDADKPVMRKVIWLEIISRKAVQQEKYSIHQW